MTKKVIAIISVLKPVDDTRNYEKIARSISNTNKYDINIIGFSTINIPSDQNIAFLPIFNFKRYHIQRLWASLKVYKNILKVKPELIIVTTPELLLVSILYKIIFGAKIIYDIQENYFRNIIYTNSYPIIFRIPIALFIRSLEIVSSLLIDRFILAEKVYLSQMKYLLSRAIIIENKALIPDYIKGMKRSKSKHFVMVYSGTIANHYGIFTALDFIKRLKVNVDNIIFVIIGFAAQDKIYHKLKNLTEDLDYIKIIGGNRLVPHHQILMEMKKANFCLLPYKKNKSTEGRIPTKLYECLAMEIPVIITPGPAWDSIVQKSNAGIIYDFNSKLDSSDHILHNKYYGKNLSSEFEWGKQSDKLLEVIHQVL